MNTTTVATAAERGRATGHNAAVADLKAGETKFCYAAMNEGIVRSEELYPDPECTAEAEAFATSYGDAYTIAMDRIDRGLAVVGYND